MRNSEHGKKQVNYFFGGADNDINPLVSELKKGFYYDAVNMSVRPDGQNDKALQKIGGEELFGTNPTQNDDYVCVGACRVCYSHTITKVFTENGVAGFWADSTGVGNSKLIIDGIVMVDSENFPITFDHPLQLDTNDSPQTPEIFATDNNVSPFIFNVQDIVDNYFNNTGKYFSSFDFDQYICFLKQQQDHPVFSELVPNLGTNGMKAGNYSYAVQYVDATGNVTSWSVYSAMITVPMRDFTVNNGIDYPNVGYYGGAVSDVSPYGIKLKIRIANEFNYDHIRIKRVAWNEGQAVGVGAVEGYSPQARYVEIPRTTYDIQAKPYGVLEFQDDSTVQWLELAENEANISLQSFETAKAVRYFNNRLLFANIKKNSMDIDDIKFVEESGEKIYPVVEKLGKKGHQDTFNHTYYKNLQTGERYTFGVQLFDSVGARTFVREIDKVQVPDRREGLTGNSEKYSVTKWKGASVCANKLNSPDNTYEVFDLEDAEVKHDYAINNASIENESFHPFTPLTNTDIDNSNTLWLEERINTRIYTKNGIKNNILNYNPKGFAPNSYSTGVGITGFANLPNWAIGISVVRSKRAGRIVAQGVCVYKMSSTRGSASKSTNTFSFYSPDLDKDVSLMTPDQQALQNGTITNYSVQIISPLGYFSEVYGGTHVNQSIPNAISVDLITYARLLKNTSDVNPGLLDSDGLNEYYAKFGKLRNPDTNMVDMIADLPDFKYKIQSLSKDPKINAYNLQVSKYDIQYTGDVYKQSGSVNLGRTGGDINDSDQKKFCEPFYIVNIINDSAQVPDNNQNQYIETGHLQKIKSIIGQSVGSARQEYSLVDERWEDCCTNWIKSAPLEVKYVYIKSNLTGIERAWVNVTDMLNTPLLTPILTGLQANGYYDMSDTLYYNDVTNQIESNPARTVRIYGVYTQSITDRYGNINPLVDTKLNVKVVFDGGLFPNTDSIYTVPKKNDLIIVKYDNRIPIKVFVGDTIVAENVAEMWRGSNTNNLLDYATGHYMQNQLKLHTGLPYYKYTLSDKVEQVETSGGHELISGVPPPLKFKSIAGGNFELGHIRQWVVMFACESQCDLAGHLSTHTIQVYPQINYVMRPFDWDKTEGKNFGEYKILGVKQWNKISPTYEDYQQGGYGTQEFPLWGYGGFKLTQRINTDYSTENNYEKRTISKPKVGFKEQTWFPTRTIYSEVRNVNEQNDTNLKTFLSDSARDISDNMGEIKFLYDNNSIKGNNLFALTESGVCLLVTDKKIISDILGNEIAALQITNNFIEQEYWISKTIGLPNENWRSTAEFNNLLWFTGKDSIYVLNEMRLNNIGKENKGSYYNKIKTLLIDNLTNSTQVCGVYDRIHNEYWVSITSNGSTNVFVCKNESEVMQGYGRFEQFAFIGRYEYNFDRYVMTDRVIGLRGVQNYELNKGYYINKGGIKQPIDASVQFVVSGDNNTAKEYIDLTVNSVNKPSVVKYYDDRNSAFQCMTDVVQMKDYNGYYMQVPRKTAAPYGRMQGNYFITELINNKLEPFVVMNVESGYKILK